MKVLVGFVVVPVYALALFYLLAGAFGFGLRIGSNIYVEESLGPLRVTYLVLLILLVCGGMSLLWWVARRSV